MKFRRDILLLGAVAVAAIVGGTLLLILRPGAGIDGFVNAEKARVTAARPNPANAEAFRATICSDEPCVLVEAGGLAILVGAGEGAADGLRARGLMRADLDAVVLPGMGLDAIAGLPGVAQGSLTVGRREPLKVYGPQGIVPVVDGANLLLAGEPSSRLSVGTDKEDQGLEGIVVFDSGVVAVRAFGGRGPDEQRVYRVDFEGKSLVIAGCRSRAEQIVSAARGTQSTAAILAAGSDRLSAGAESECLAVSDVLEAAMQARFDAILLSALKPSTAISGAAEAWRDVLRGEKAVVGAVGATIDLSPVKPTITEAR
ncbi:MAG TPA: hypothetical protein PLN33_06250 [Hyphomonadaceae bacterium]|nr:hypothetical protein [Hyphomonadaceae bacterium]HPN05375.1 hypothetical protein [Hyphomonadaceae bacterium]